jgi:hypothetical protein
VVQGILLIRFGILLMIRPQCTLTSSRAIRHVNVGIVSQLSETVSVPHIRDSYDECRVFVLYLEERDGVHSAS